MFDGKQSDCCIYLLEPKPFSLCGAQLTIPGGTLAGAAVVRARGSGDGGGRARGTGAGGERERRRAPPLPAARRLPAAAAQAGAQPGGERQRPGRRGGRAADDCQPARQRLLQGAPKP
eukprot:1193384-Prorocentrum_minimum.AAC.5